MSTVCRRACEADRLGLKTLWLLSFEEDSEQDIDRFFDTFPDTAYVLCEDDRVQSMLWLLPITIEHGTNRVSAGYIYAGATHPAARGKGFYRRLLSYVSDCAEQDGLAALVLRPATPALDESYRRMGFTIPLIGSVPMPVAAKGGLLQPLSAKEYAWHRRSVFQKRGQAFVQWDERTIAYALLWCDAYQTENGCALLSRDTETVLEQTDGNCQTAARMKPLGASLEIPTPIWFGYGLE